MNKSFLVAVVCVLAGCHVTVERPHGHAGSNAHMNAGAGGHEVTDAGSGMTDSGEPTSVDAGKQHERDAAVPSMIDAGPVDHDSDSGMDGAGTGGDAAGAGGSAAGSGGTDAPNPPDMPKEKPPAPDIVESTPYSGLPSPTPLLRGHSVAGKVSLFVGTACEGAPAVTFDAESGIWHHSVTVPAGSSDVYAQTEVDGLKSDCSQPFAYVNDPSNVVMATIGTITRDDRDFHTLNVSGTESTFTQLTAFDTRDCTGNELGRTEISAGGGEYTLQLDVPADMTVLQFSLRAQRSVTQESICVPFNGYYALGPLSIVNFTYMWTLNDQNLIEVMAQITPNDFTYASSTIYRTADCHISAQSSDAPTWSTTFTNDNFDTTDLSVGSTDVTGRSICQSFPDALSYAEDATQVVPGIYIESSGPADTFSGTLGYYLPDGSFPDNALDTRDYRINVSRDSSCASVINNRPFDVSEGQSVSYPLAQGGHLYGYTIRRTVQPPTRSICKLIK